jgi:hypothetical protein
MLPIYAFKFYAILWGQKIGDKKKTLKIAFGGTCWITIRKSKT